MAISPVVVAFNTVKAGASAREGLRQFRAAGGAIRDATWFQLVGQARTAVRLQVVESTLPLYRRPTPPEIATLSTKVAEGFIQYVNVYVRDRDTGVVSIRHYAVRTRGLISRQNAIDRAVFAMTASTLPFGSFPNDTVLGGVYAATYQMIPRGAEAA